MGKSLTPRQREVVRLAGKGLTNQEIADVLGIKLATVKVHIENALRILGASNRAEAAVMLGDLERDEAGDRVVDADAPALALLPLEVAEEASQRRLADGLVDSLNHSLSQLWYPVIGRSASFFAAGTDLTALRSASNILRAQYLLEGSFDARGGGFGARLRLVDLSTHHVVWQGPFEGSLDDLRGVTPVAAQQIASSLGRALTQRVADRVTGGGDKAFRPWELAAAGLAYLWQHTADANLEARGLFRRALSLEPRLPLAHRGLCMTHQRDIIEQWGDDPDGALSAFSDASGEFARLVPDDPRASVNRAFSETYAGRRDAATAHVEFGLARAPSDGVGRCLYGQLMAMGGDAKPALRELAYARRVLPCGVERWPIEVATALTHFVAEDYDKAVKGAHTAIAAFDRSALPYAVLASSHAHAGNMREARRAFAELEARKHRANDKRFERMLSSTDPQIAARYLEGLARAAA